MRDWQPFTCQQWVLLNFTQGPFPSGQVTSPMPWFLLQGSHRRTSLLCLTLGLCSFLRQNFGCLTFLSQTAIIPVCHLSMKDLGLTSQKDIFDFITLKGDYHLTTSWCCTNNSKSPTFMGSHVLRASACNGSLVSELTKSSNFTGTYSYCILTTGHHKCILTKYMTRLEKSCLSTPCASIFYQQP
jgi:hypothetical protein